MGSDLKKVMLAGGEILVSIHTPAWGVTPGYVVTCLS